MSTLPSECEQLLISGYVLGNLSPAEALLFEELMRDNPELLEQVRLMQEALDSAYAPTEVEPPPALRDRVLATAKSQQANSVEVKSSAKNREVAAEEGREKVTTTPKLSWGKILGAIALAIITALGIINYRLWQTVQTANSTDSQNATKDRLTYLLKDRDSSKKYATQLIVDRDRLSATLIASNLPPLPLDKVYALWTVVGKDVPYTTDEKGAILTAVFQVPQSGNLVREIAVPQPHLEYRVIKKVALTVEDISAPQAHEGSIFISTE